MKVIIPVNGEEVEITVDQAIDIYREIHEQLYPATKDNK